MSESDVLQYLLSSSVRTYLLTCTSWVAILHEKLAGETFTRVLDFWRQLPVLRVRQLIGKNVGRSALDGIRRSSVSVLYSQMSRVCLTHVKWIHDRK